jgi:hypothetical protein
MLLRFLKIAPDALAFSHGAVMVWVRASGRSYRWRIWALFVVSFFWAPAALSQLRLRTMLGWIPAC